MSKVENIYCRKDFLNMDGFESDASIFSLINFLPADGNEPDHYDIQLKIRDCYKVIELNLRFFGGGPT